MSRQNFLLVFLPRKHLSHNDNNELSCWRVGDEFYRRRNGGPGGDLRWRSSLRLAPAPPIYEVMGDHGSLAGTSATPSISYLDFLISKFYIFRLRCSPWRRRSENPRGIMQSWCSTANITIICQTTWRRFLCYMRSVTHYQLRYYAF